MRVLLDENFPLELIGVTALTSTVHPEKRSVGAPADDYGASNQPP